MYFKPPYRANVLTPARWIPINLNSDEELRIFKQKMDEDKEIYVVTCTHEELYLTND